MELNHKRNAVRKEWNETIHSHGMTEMVIDMKGEI